jgi:hypothetical protein
MADDNRFFRWLWRINSLLFFLVILGVLIAFFIMFAGEVPHGPTPMAQMKSGEDTYAFGGGLGEASNSSLLTHLDGTEENIAVLRRNSRGNPYGLGSGSRSYDGGGTVNLLSLDLKTMKNRWLFPGVKRDIESVYQVRTSVPVPQNASDSVTALLMDVADADTNGDGKIASSDHHALYVYRIGTAAPVKLIDAWWVSGVQQLDGERVVVTYYDGKADHAVLISAKDFRVVADTILSATPK